MKSKRFAFISHGIFDERVCVGLARALVELGHYCAVFSPPPTKENLASFDIVFAPQQPRPKEVSHDAVYITWAFDWYGHSDPDYTTLRDHDLLYSLGDPAILSLPHFPQSRGSLCIATDKHLLDRPPIEPTLDFSLAGSIPPASWFILPTLMPDGHRFNIISEVTGLVTDGLTIPPLAGAYHQATELERFKQRLSELIAKRNWKLDDSWIDDMHAYGARLLFQCARLRNRGTLAQLVLSISQNIEFWGFHWDMIPMTYRFAHPFHYDNELLCDLYQRSRINLHDNIIGFSLHWRVLDCMAVGGFIMAHESPHFGKPGQMTETFSAYCHFGEYSAGTFVEQARYWLANAEARKKAVDKARKVIRDKHLWIHRAQQILKDLEI